MSRPSHPAEGQHVPRGGENGARGFAGWMILAAGGLALVNTGVSSVGAGATGSDWSFALLAALICAITSRGLWLGARWAWWVSVTCGSAGLFFVLPVTVAVLFGESREPVGTGWDVVLFPVITAIVLALLAALWIARPQRKVA